MPKLILGFLLGTLFGSMLGCLLPVEVFLIAGIILVILAGLLFFILHLGVRDFQGY